MIKYFGFIIALMVGLALIAGCGSPLADGTITGVVLHESDGTPVANPVIVIGRVHASPLAPATSYIGTKEGKFTIVVNGGNYNLQIGTKKDGPFYMWPEVVYITPDDTTNVTLVLPPGY
jgi:hypothetical protein